VGVEVARPLFDTRAKPIPPSMPKLRLGQLNSEVLLMLFRIENVQRGRMRAIMQMHGERDEVDRAISNDA
jgi:hypothetical protein